MSEIERLRRMVERQETMGDGRFSAEDTRALLDAYDALNLELAEYKEALKDREYSPESIYARYSEQLTYTSELREKYSALETVTQGLAEAVQGWIDEEDFPPSRIADGVAALAAWKEYEVHRR